MINHKILIFITIFSFNFLYSQDYSKEAKTYFENYLSKKDFIDMLYNSFPTIEDCKLVFNRQDAYTYYGFIEDLKRKFKRVNQKNNNQSFYKIEIASGSTNEIIRDADKNSQGMEGIADKLKPNVIFYAVKVFSSENDKQGDYIRYFVKINSKWVYFYKPEDAF